MKLLNKYFAILFFVCFACFAGVSSAQNINKISSKCPNPSRLFANITILTIGDINYRPCAGRSSFFFDTVDFTNATVVGLPVPAGTVSGTGTANHIPRFTAASVIADTPATWNGSTFFYTDTPATATFSSAFTPASGTGLYNVGSATHKIFLDQSAGSTLLAVPNTGSVTLTNQTADFTFLFDATANIQSALLGNGGQFRLYSNTNNASFRTDGVISWLYNRTLTAAGTTGAQTISKPSGSVNFAAGASALVVTNTTVAVTSFVFALAQTNDATCFVANVVPGAGSFTINMTAPCTAETRVAFQVNN